MFIVKLFCFVLAGLSVFFCVWLLIEEGGVWLQDSWLSYRKSYLGRVGKTLDDLYASVQAHQFMSWNAASIALFFLLFYFSFRSFLAGAVGALGGFILPQMMLKKLKRDRLRKFNQQLVQACESIASALKAGHTFLQAMNVLVKEAQRPLKDEFEVFLKEHKLGLSLEESLQHLLTRVGSQDLEVVVSAVLVSRQTGANLAEILNQIAVTLREKRKLEGQVVALTAQGRLSGIIVGILPVFLCLVIYLVDPELISPLFNTTLGNLMLLAGAVMELLGALWIKRLLTIDF